MLTLLERPNVDGLYIIRKAVWSPDGSRLGVVRFLRIKGEPSSEVLVWNPECSSELLSLEVVPGNIMSIGFLPNGELIAALPNRNLVTWDVISGKRQNVVPAISEKPRGRPPILAASSRANTVFVWYSRYTGGITLARWNLESNLRQKESEIQNSNTGGYNNGKVESGLLCLDEQILVFAEGSNIRCVGVDRSWKTPTTLYSGTTSVERLFASPDGKHLGFAMGSRVFIGDLSSGELRNVAEFKGHQSFVFAAAFAGDEKTLVTGGQDGTTRVWNVKTNRETACYDWNVVRVTALAVSSDGSTIVVGGDGPQSLVMWDLD